MTPLAFAGARDGHGTVSVDPLPSGVRIAVARDLTIKPATATVPTRDVPEVAARLARQMHEAANLPPPLLLERVELPPGGGVIYVGNPAVPGAAVRRTGDRHKPVHLAVPDHPIGSGDARRLAAVLAALADEADAEPEPEPEPDGALVDTILGVLASGTAARSVAGWRMAVAAARAVEARYVLTERGDRP